VIGQLTSKLHEDRDDLRSHQALIKERVKANHYAENYLDNKAVTPPHCAL